ncbi:AAA family ATPase [Clostridium perfringens]|uniref:AAA family ATPase n=1 Tax=Clostridium perfringens TaxID=1502 RepID=UPI003BA8D4D2
MKNTIVRLQEIEIKNLKNVEYGKVTLQSYNNLRKKINGTKEEKATDVLGIYGQNGSGKTSLVDSINILETLLLGKELSSDIKYLINNNEANNYLELNFKFFIKNLNGEFLVDYKVTLNKCKENDGIRVENEALSYSNIWNKNERSKEIVDYNINNEECVFYPKKIYNMVIKNEKSNNINLNVSKAISIEKSTSFIFNERTLNILNQSLEENLSNILNSLVYFAKFNLFVIRNEQSGIINMNSLLPFSFRLENEGSIISGGYIALFKKSNLEEDKLELLKKIINQINIVIKYIIPEFEIGIEEYGKQLDEEGKLTTEIELVSIRENKEIPLKYESDGIKKIISILSAIIAMYNNETICVVIDELDAGIFEYLLGEILGVLEERAKGQLIFTSHNLRALEKLGKDSIIFTTINPKNRYVKLTNVKSNNNLRDFYYRVISLGGQKEGLYNETNTFEMSYAFRKAGKILNE